MKVALATHDAALGHDSGPGHPERPARVDAVVAGVEASGLEIVRVDPPPAEPGDLALVHTSSYVAAVAEFLEAGGGYFDADTHGVPASWEAAVRAAGAGPALVDVLDDGAADVGFSAMRPPGHHAEVSRAMGFCLFNNVAVAARLLQQRDARVAIVDWDVHHGNGTQHSFYGDGDVLYVSLHQSPFYPGTGHIDEIGTEAGVGTTVNLPFRGGTDGTAYRHAMANLVCDVIADFRPDWLLVSAGYDAHRADPLAGILLSEADYGAMAHLMAPLVPGRRTIFFLEGGYDLAALTGSTAATLQGWAGTDFGDTAGEVDADAELVIERVRAALGR